MRRRREELGWSRVELSERASARTLDPEGVSEWWIQWLELTYSGPAVPRVDRLRPVAEALGVWDQVRNLAGFGP